MKHINPILLAACCALGNLLASAPALAHSNETRAGKPGIVKKEQKPWGIAGDAKSNTRTIPVRMSDAMRFRPDRLDVQPGETIRFVITNTGKMLHELVIGTKKDLDEHAALMIKFPGMEHEEPYMAHVPPGKSAQIVWTFNRPGQFDFACLIAGHYQAGMVGKINVKPR